MREQQGALWRYLRLLGARPDEVEDVMQDAFVALFRSYPTEPEDSQVRLLRTIARRRLFELRRRTDPAVVTWSDEVDAWLAQRDQVLSDEYSEALGSCLDELAPRARKGLTLRHVEDRSVADVASELGLERTGALALLQRARDVLRACLRRRAGRPPLVDLAAASDADPSHLTRRA